MAVAEAGWKSRDRTEWFLYNGRILLLCRCSGYICTGFVDAAADETTGKVNVYLASGKTTDSVAAGTYYASEDGDAPEKGLGNIQKSSWVKQNTAWRYLDENGRAVDTTEKAGWQNIQKTWYALKTDGTVDESVMVGKMSAIYGSTAQKVWEQLKPAGRMWQIKPGFI